MGAQAVHAPQGRALSAQQHAWTHACVGTAPMAYSCMHAGRGITNAFACLCGSCAAALHVAHMDEGEGLHGIQHALPGCELPWLLSLPSSMPPPAAAPDLAAAAAAAAAAIVASSTPSASAAAAAPWPLITLSLPASRSSSLSAPGGSEARCTPSTPARGARKHACSAILSHTGLSLV